MNSLYNLLWVSDELKPLKFDDYCMTSRGRVYFDDENSQCFIRDARKKRTGTYLYDSSYDVYEFDLKYNLILHNEKEYEVNNIGYNEIIEDKDDYIEYVISDNELYILSISDNYTDLLSFLINKYKIKFVYCKKRILDNYEIIRFSFPHYKLSSDYFLIDEGYKSGLLGDYIDNKHFSMGVFKYNDDSKYPLLMWPRDNKIYENKLVETNLYEFKKEIQQIKEFKYEENELEIVKTSHGKYYFLKDSDKIIGFVTFGKIFKTFAYIEDLAIIKEYRKTGASTVLINSIKAIANSLSINLILTIEEPKLLKYYINHGFKNIGMFKFE